MRQYVSSQRNFIEMLKYINCYGHLWQPFAGIQRAVNLIREKKIRVANLLPAVILAVIAAFLPVSF